MAPSCTLENGIKLEHPNPPSALRWSFQQLIPALCHECRRVIRAEHFDDPAAPFLCNTCLEKLPWFEPQGRCSYCGLEIEPESKTPCSHGVSRTWHLDRLHSAFVYRGILQDWVLSFKFGSRQSLSFLLGRLFALGMIGQGVEKDFSCMVPIPLHQKRLRSRGFNQSLLLAYQLLKNIKAKPSLLRPRVLRRVRETIPQTELPYPERLKNPDDAFAVGDSVPPGTILLIDDVMTTGSTLNAAARTLKASGAERVSAWVLCRSVIGNDSRDLIQ